MKIKIKLIIMILLACAVHGAQAQFFVAGDEFIPQSEFFYQQAVNPDRGIFRAIGGGEGMDIGDDISDNDKDSHVNDAPLGDGILPLLLAALIYLICHLPDSIRDPYSRLIKEIAGRARNDKRIE